MANFFYGEKSRRPGTYKCIVNRGKNNLFSAASDSGASNRVTVELLVTDEVLHAKGPAFVMEADEAVMLKKITRPKVKEETLIIKSSRA